MGKDAQQAADQPSSCAAVTELSLTPA